MTLLINDNELVEGILGGLGWLVAMFEIKNVVLAGSNPVISGIFSWSILWYIRKIGMNLYRDYKKRRGLEGDQLKLTEHSGNIPLLIFVMLLALLFVVGMSNNWHFNQRDLLLTGFIGSLFMIMYIT